jgi:RecJ-like exonuclease
MKRAPLVFLILGTLGLSCLTPESEAPGQEAEPRKELATACRACHKEQHAVWRDGAHARAGARLKDDERKDASCLACHAPGGDVTAGVACADCHGTGFECGDWHQAMSGGRKLSSERACRECHRRSERHPDAEFQFTLDYAAIAHANTEKPDPFTSKGVYRQFKTYLP